MPPRSVHRTIEIFRSLRNGELRSLWFSEWISDAGSFITSIALAVYVHQLTGRATAVGLALALRYIPGFTIGPWAGVLVDRLDRRLVMVASDLSRAALVGSLPFTHSVGQAYVITLAASIAATVFTPARSALLPLVAPREQLVPALAVMETTHHVLHTVGPALGGLAVLAVGARPAFFLDAASFLISAAFILTVQPRGVAAASGRSAARELRDGFAAVVNAPAARAYALTAMAIYFGFSGVVALLVDYVRDTLGRPGGDYGIVLGVAGLGTVAASLAIAARDAHHARTPWAFVAVGGLAAFAMTGLSPTFIVLLPIALVGGLSDGGIGIPMSATLVETLPDELRGRAYGAVNALEYAAAAAGSLLFPWISDGTGVPAAIALAAGVGATLALVALGLGGRRAIAEHERTRLAALGVSTAARAASEPPPPSE